MKKSVLLIMSGLALCLRAPAQTVIVTPPGEQVIIDQGESFNSLIDLLNANPTGSRCYVKSFHAGGSSGGGDFISVTSGTADNINIYKSASGKLWKRVVPRNTPQTYGGGDGERAYSYSTTQLSMLYPVSISISPGDLSDWIAIQTMRTAAANGYGADIVKGNFYINKSTDLFKGSAKLQAEDWKGSNWYAKGGRYIGIKSFSCSSMQECLDVNTNFQYDLTNLIYNGNGGLAVYLIGFQRNQVLHNEFRNCDTAVIGEFTMNSNWSFNSYFNCKYHLILKHAEKTGCGLAKCQSNANIVMGNRHVITTGTIACNTIIDASDVKFINNSFERNGTGTAEYGYYFDSKNATVVKQFSIEGDSVADAMAIDGSHKEATFTKSYIKAFLSPASYLPVRDVYDQNADNFMDVSVYSGYAAIVVEDCYLTNSSTFTSSGNGMRWFFRRIFGAGKTPTWKNGAGTIKENQPRQ